jgi:hypothetical protein
MPAEKPIVLVTEGSDAVPLDWLRGQADVIEMPTTDPGFPAALSHMDWLSAPTRK